MNRLRRITPSASSPHPIADDTSPTPIIGTDNRLWSPSIDVVAPTTPAIANPSPIGPRIAPLTIRAVPRDGGPLLVCGSVNSAYSGICPPGGPHDASAPASGA